MITIVKKIKEPDRTNKLKTTSHLVYKHEEQSKKRFCTGTNKRTLLLKVL